MNTKHILYNLKEAKEELDRTIVEIENNKDHEYGEFLVEMAHLYHHLNTAWNAREATEKETVECSDENFAKWRKFPKDEELLLNE